ncbi:MAG TPA: VOC family protein [Candidatus Eisenbacteria bacterium]
MSTPDKPEQGAITWIDLTVPNADDVRRFYADVVGWATERVSMGEYDDFNMVGPKSGRAMAGVCHAQGMNADLPAQWLIYINVANLDHSIARCQELGGTIVRPATPMGEYGRYAVIRDPAGAVAAIFEPASGVG